MLDVITTMKSNATAAMAHGNHRVVSQKAYDEVAAQAPSTPEVTPTPTQKKDVPHLAAVSDARIMTHWRKLDRVTVGAELNGATGYMEPLVGEDLGLATDRPHAFRTSNGRPGVIYPTMLGNVVLFQRYNDTGSVWASNVPMELKMLLPNRALSVGNIVDFIANPGNPFEDHIERMLGAFEFTAEDGSPVQVAI